MNYWLEAVEASFCGNGITATKEQIKSVASDMEINHENYGMSCGYVENPLIHEMKKLNEKIKMVEAEKEKEIASVKALALRARGLRSDVAYVSTSNGESHFERV